MDKVVKAAALARDKKNRQNCWTGTSNEDQWAVSGDLTFFEKFRWRNGEIEQSRR